MFSLYAEHPCVEFSIQIQYLLHACDILIDFFAKFMQNLIFVINSKQSSIFLRFNNI